jgi:predicted Holliday junction resolvase-like endonuclease
MWYIILLILIIVVLIVSQTRRGKEKVSSLFAHQEESTQLKDTKRKVEDHYNLQKRQKEKEIDSILDKINQYGIDSLTKKEKELLDIYSKEDK